MTNCHLKAHSFIPLLKCIYVFLSISLSPLLSLPSQNHLNPDLYINDIQLSITNILYFVALFIAALMFDSCMPPVFEKKKNNGVNEFYKLTIVSLEIMRS